MYLNGLGDSFGDGLKAKSAGIALRANVRCEGSRGL